MAVTQRGSEDTVPASGELLAVDITAVATTVVFASECAIYIIKPANADVTVGHDRGTLC